MSTKLQERSDSGALEKPREVTAHNVITVERVCDPRRPDVHFALVELDSHGHHLHEHLTDGGEGLTLATLKTIAPVYAQMFGDDYLAGGWR